MLLPAFAKLERWLASKATIKLGSSSWQGHRRSAAATSFASAARRRSASVWTWPRAGNLTKLGQNLDAAMTEIRNALPVGIDFEKVADQPKVVEYAGGEFYLSFVEALSIVLFVSLVSLGLRTGIFVALSAPLVLSFGRAGFKPFASLQPSTASRRSLPSTIGRTPHPVITSATPIRRHREHSQGAEVPTGRADHDPSRRDARYAREMMRATPPPLPELGGRPSGEFRRGLTEQVAGDVDQSEAPPVFRQMLVGFHDDLDGFLAGVDLDPDRLFREVDFMATTGFAADYRMGHWTASEMV